MAKVPIINSVGKVEFVDSNARDVSGDAAASVEVFRGFGPYGTYTCLKHANVKIDDISFVLISEEACMLADKANFHYVTDALFMAAMFNDDSDEVKTMISSLFNRDIQKQMSFAQELALIINRQEHVVKFSDEMSPQFIRQLEDANIIRKARQSDKIQIADVLKAILYSCSPVGELMLRYGIDDAKITRCCRE